MFSARWARLASPECWVVDTMGPIVWALRCRFLLKVETLSLMRVAAEREPQEWNEKLEKLWTSALLTSLLTILQNHAINFSPFGGRLFGKFPRSHHAWMRRVSGTSFVSHYSANTMKVWMFFRSGARSLTNGARWRWRRRRQNEWIHQGIWQVTSFWFAIMFYIESERLNNMAESCWTQTRPHRMRYPKWQHKDHIGASCCVAAGIGDHFCFFMHRLMCKRHRHYQYANEFISRNHLQCNTLCVTQRPSMNEHRSIHWCRVWWTQCVSVRFGCYFCVRGASQLNRVKIEGVQRITISTACCSRLCFSSQKFVFYLYLFNGSRLNVCIDDAWPRPPYRRASIYSRVHSLLGTIWRIK